MKRLLRWLRGPRKDTPAEFFSLPAAPEAPDWGPDEQAHWRQFLLSPGGKALMGRMRAVHYAVATGACADAFNTVHAGGRAAGWQEAMSWLETLSRASRANEEPTPGNRGESTDNHRPGEAELIERYSP